MTIEQLEKAKSILEDLREYREFLKEYDKSHDKVITVKKSFLSSFKSTFDFSKDAHLKKVIREHIVSQIEDLEKQLKELGDSSQTNLQGGCKVVSDELQKHGEFYDAFVESVASVLKPRERYVGDGCFCIDIDDGTDYKGLADEIVKRISGEE